MQTNAQPVILTGLPELKNGERFYCGAVTPLLIRENGKAKKVIFHLIVDESDTSKRLNQKFPGGRVEPVDYDEEMWNANFHEQLKNAKYNSVEISIIENFFKERKLNIFERTLVRELVTETGYVPMQWAFLTGEVQKENQTAGKEDRDFYQLFFHITEMVERSENSTSGISNRLGLSEVVDILPDKDFQSLDLAVKNSRLAVEKEKIFQQGKLVRSHHPAAKAVIDKLMHDREYCLVMY